MRSIPSFLLCSPLLLLPASGQATLEVRRSSYLDKSATAPKSTTLLKNIPDAFKRFSRNDTASPKKNRLPGGRLKPVEEGPLPKNSESAQTPVP